MFPKTIIAASFAFVCLSGSAFAGTITTSPLACTVTDSSGAVVSNTCTAPDGNTLSLSGAIGISLGDSLYATGPLGGFDAVSQYGPAVTGASLSSSAYRFFYSESVTGSAFFEAVGGTGAGFINIQVQETDKKHGGAMINGSASLTFDGLGLIGTCDVFGCSETLPIIFGQPFEVSASATASDYFGYAENAGYASFYQVKAISIVSIADSNGKVIPGAFLFDPSPVPEPSTFPMLALAFGALLSARLPARKSRHDRS